MSVPTKKTLSAGINQARVLFAQNQLDPARRTIKKVLKKAPRNAQALYLSGIIEFKRGNTDLAIKHLSAALQTQNDIAEWHRDLAVMYLTTRQFKEAVHAAHRAVQLQEDYPDALSTLGEALAELGDYENAIIAYAKALTGNDRLISAYSGIALCLNETGQTDQAINALLKALTITPDDPLIHGNLAAFYYYIGLVDEAIDALLKKVALLPDSASDHSSLIATVIYRYDFNDAVFRHYLHYSVKHGLPLAAEIKPHLNNPDSGRKLKIGYVSADFRQHAVAFYITPILAQHDKQKFEVYCYHNSRHDDSHTAKIRDFADHWIDCIQMSDAALADKIRQDGIDILLDLSGHSMGNRLSIFARKPAPVQITFIGFPTTTGLIAMDYMILNKGMITDAAKPYFSEKLILLDKIAPFSPPENAPDINALPALKNNFVTFASFNAPYKITDDMIALWCKILTRLPDSKFVLYLGKTQSRVVRNIFLNKFSAHGIDSARIDFHSLLPTPEYLDAHHAIDICLDSFPYNGSTTTFISLWMGVPVITLKGISPQSNQAASILAMIQLEQFITRTEHDYVELACATAHNLNELSALRPTLRERMKTSGITDSENITSDLEQAYLKVWKNWCEGRSPQEFILNS
ncbi:MAG: hypothetical protein CVV13_14075 [Gammaproteobacteria bacterium HGW-Gammaproteobacteria-3]|nr:MAG: hypothetical protein CVV13_14075 [Gammaproteobacteria bacterium HGW-Gammaproteobacteria-3]